MDILNEFRELQIKQDFAKWSPRTQTLIRLGDLSAQQVFRAYCEYARRGEFDHIYLFVDPRKICVDVGSNYGQNALKLSAISKAVLCIEPIKALNFVGNILPENCLFKSIAIGRARGKVILRIPIKDREYNYAMSTMALDNPLVGYDFEEELVEVITLDELIQESFSNDKIGFINIDVEGFEGEVIEGALKTLKNHKPNLQIELHGDEGINSMCNFLKNLGYRGLFFFNNRIFDVSQFDLSVHRAPENESSRRIQTGMSFDPNLFVCYFFFIPRIE